MKTLSIAAALLFAFGTVTFAQDASSTSTKTSTTKTTTTKTVKKHGTGHPKKGPKKTDATPAAK